MSRSKLFKDKDANELVISKIRGGEMDGFSKHRRRRLIGVHAEGIWLTPVQARRLAKTLLEFATWAEVKNGS